MTLLPHRGDRPRVPGRRRQAFAAFHYAGGLRRERRAGHAERRGAARRAFSDAVKRVARWPSRSSTRRRWCTTTSKTTTGFVTAGRAAPPVRPAVALNVGDYLIGLGYRLVAAQRVRAGAGGHGRHPGRSSPGPTRALRGPGGRVGVARRPRPTSLAAGRAEDLRAKTAPAFEAAILAGVRLAGPLSPTARRPAASPGTSASPTRSSTTWTTGRRKAHERASGRTSWAAAHRALGPGPGRLGDADRAELIALGQTRRGEATLARARELYASGAFRQAAAWWRSITAARARPPTPSPPLPCAPLPLPGRRHPRPPAAVDPRRPGDLGLGRGGSCSAVPKRNYRGSSEADAPNKRGSYSTPCLAPRFVAMKSRHLTRRCGPHVLWKLPAQQHAGDGPRRRAGEVCAAAPLYTPLRTEEEPDGTEWLAHRRGERLSSAACGLLSPYAAVAGLVLRSPPALLRWLLRDGRRLRPSIWGALTVSVLKGEEGRQHKELAQTGALAKS